MLFTAFLFIYFLIKFPKSTFTPKVGYFGTCAAFWQALMSLYELIQVKKRFVQVYWWLIEFLHRKLGLCAQIWHQVRTKPTTDTVLWSPARCYLRGRGLIQNPNGSSRRQGSGCESFPYLTVEALKVSTRSNEMSRSYTIPLRIPPRRPPHKYTAQSTLSAVYSIPESPPPPSYQESFRIIWIMWQSL